MYRIIKPKKFQLYVTSKSNKKYAYEVREETGADIVINCTLYNTSTWKPVCDVKADGTILSNDQYAYWGYGWNNNESTMHMVNNINLYQNYISCAALIRDNSDCLITANDDVLRAAGRTAIGFREDGQMVAVNDIAKALATIDIELYNTQTGFTGLWDILQQVNQQWDTMDDGQRNYIATMFAGTRQMNRFVARTADAWRGKRSVIVRFD